MNYNYTEDQRHAIKTDAPYFLLIGSAGTGKTHVLVERIDYLVKQIKLNPKHILILTTTVNDMYNIMNKLDEHLDISNISIFTLEMFALKVILDHEGYNKKFLSKEELAEIKENIIKSEMITNKKYEDYKRTPSIFSNHTVRINGAYENYLKTHKVSLNEDFVSYAFKLFSEDKKLQNKYHNMYSHIFIDNAQDIYGTSKSFVFKLFDNTQNIYVLGNDDQLMEDIDIKSTYLYDVYLDKNFERKVLVDNYKTNLSILRFASMIEKNTSRLIPEIKYMRQDHFKPNLNILSSEEEIYKEMISTIKQLNEDEIETELFDIAVIVSNEDKPSMIKRLEKEGLLNHIDKEEMIDCDRLVDGLSNYAEDPLIDKTNFLTFMLRTMDELGLDKQTKASYMRLISLYQKISKVISIKNFIIFLQTKSYMKVYQVEPSSVNVLTLEETKGLDFKYVFIKDITSLLTNQLVQSRKIVYNLLFTARDLVYLYDLKNSNHEVLEELKKIKENWIKISVKKSIYKDIIYIPTNTYLRMEQHHIFEEVKIKYKAYPKLYNELQYLIELIINFDKILNGKETNSNIDIYMQAFRYFIQHTLKVTLDVAFNEKRNRIAGYLSGGSAGGFNMDRDYDYLINQKLLDKSFTISEFKSVHDIYRYLSATHHKHDYEKSVSKNEKDQAKKNIEIYQGLTNRDKIRYYVAVIKLYHALNLNDKHLSLIDAKIA